MKTTIIFSLCTLSIFSCSPSLAGTWDNLWFNHDQQASRALAEGDPRQAAKLFTTPSWQGVANYKAGHYQKAAEEFSKDTTPQGQYNLGNALAHLGDYKNALAAYDKALSQQASFPDAKFNRNLVEKLLREQEKKQQQNQQQNQQQAQQQNQQQAQQQNQQQAQQQNQQQTQQQNQQQAQQQNQQQAQQQNQQQAQQQNQQQTQQQNQQQAQQQNQQQTQQQNQQQAQQQNQQQAQQQNQQQAQQQNQQQAQQQNQQQAQQPNKVTQQWLRQIPDDPGGLLQQLFLRDYLRRHAEETKEIS